MRHVFLHRPSGLYREAAGREGFAHAWPYSQALSATIAMSRVPDRGRAYRADARRAVAMLGRYQRTDGAYAAALGASGDVYYDDNEWIALELLRWYELRRDRTALMGARRLFELVLTAWDRNPSHPCPGGVFWTDRRDNEERNTVTTATGALLAMHLYALTRNPDYVQWARRMLQWVSDCMLAPNGLLWDHLDLEGIVDQRHWSYNQGTAIGANVLLYRLTGDANALERGRSLADSSLAYFDRTPAGAEPPYFLAIFFRNLLELDRVDGHVRYRQEAQAYADAVWERVRDPATGLFRFHGDAHAELLNQAAMVQIYATLAESAEITASP
jgi:hypothetical protein